MFSSSCPNLRFHIKKSESALIKSIKNCALSGRVLSRRLPHRKAFESPCMRITLEASHLKIWLSPKTWLSLVWKYDYLLLFNFMIIPFYADGRTVQWSAVWDRQSRVQPQGLVCRKLQRQGSACHCEKQDCPGIMDMFVWKCVWVCLFLWACVLLCWSAHARLFIVREENTSKSCLRCSSHSLVLKQNLCGSSSIFFFFYLSKRNKI
jgi:hypothetical protein